LLQNSYFFLGNRSSGAPTEHLLKSNPAGYNRQSSQTGTKRETAREGEQQVQNSYSRNILFSESCKIIHATFIYIIFYLETTYHLSVDKLTPTIFST
jgi:hypothetical protein